MPATLSALFVMPREKCDNIHLVRDSDYVTIGSLDAAKRHSQSSLITLLWGKISSFYVRGTIENQKRFIRALIERYSDEFTNLFSAIGITISQA